jgi:serine/threonine-protein kinase
MSPEQATATARSKGRSDVYSLAAVLYEMIAGEPPVTGATKQAIIAKLLTEAPTKLRVIRTAVPESVERATEKALSKAPADRFATAGAFARALDAPARRRRRRSGTRMVEPAELLRRSASAGSVAIVALLRC